jgi:hypothetical protein
MRKISPVISLDESDNLLRVCHKSFTLDSNRSGSFSVDCATQNANLAHGCLQLLNSLKFNFLKLESSHCFNDDIPDLEARVTSVITTSLSCYWAEYLEELLDEKISRDSILKVLRKFLYEHVLHWLLGEVLSIIKSV